MTIQSVSTLVELGRPQKSYRVDQSRVLRAQLSALLIGLVLFIVFAAVATFGSQRQAAQGNAEGRVIMLWLGAGFALAGLGFGVAVAARLQAERRTHAIIHDNGLCLVTRRGETLVRWTDLKEVVELPATNIVALASGLFGFLLQRLLSGGESIRYALDLRDGTRLLLPSHLENLSDLMERLRRPSPGPAGPSPAVSGPSPAAAGPSPLAPLPETGERGTG